MVHSPSKRWENGVLVERAISSDLTGDPHENEATATKEYRTPLVTPRNDADKKTYAKERAVSRTPDPVADAKAVQEAENKAIVDDLTSKKSRKK